MASNEPDDNEVVDEARAFVQLAQESLSNAKHLDEGVRKRIQTKLNDLRHTIEAGEPDEVAGELSAAPITLEGYAEVAADGRAGDGTGGESHRDGQRVAVRQAAVGGRPGDALVVALRKTE